VNKDKDYSWSRESRFHPERVEKWTECKREWHNRSL